MLDITASSDAYNGWTNRETWLVSLWLLNEEGTYTEARRLATLPEPDGELKEYVEQLIADEYDKSSMLTDLINSALARVDWREIAASFGYE